MLPQPPVGVQLPVERQRPVLQPGDPGAERLRRRRLPGPVHLLRRVQLQPAAGDFGREGGPLRLGPAELLVRHHAHRERRLDADQRRRVLGIRQRGERGQHRADAGLDQPVPVSVRPVRAVAEPGANQYHDNYEGTSHSGYHFGTLFNLDTAISNRYGAWSSLAQYVAGGAGPELRGHPRAVRGVHRPLHEHRGAVDRHDLLADEQGLADAAVVALQQRRRPGRGVLRRAEGEPDAARASTRWTTAR